MDFSPDEIKVIDRFRKTQLYKLDCQSDFITLRQCYKVAKDLYEALKYFDSRASRFKQDFSSYNQKVYAKRRSYSRPSDYYSFKYFDVTINLEKSHSEYFVSCCGFKPRTFKISYSTSSGFYACAHTPVFSDAVVCWMKVIFEFLDSRFNLGL